MSVVFPGLDSKEFEAEAAQLDQSLSHLAQLFDARGVGKLERAREADDAKDDFEEVVAAWNALAERFQTMGSYLYCMVAADSRDELAQAKLSELQAKSVRLANLQNRLVAWLGSLDIDGLVRISPVAEAHAFALRKAKTRSEHMMEPALEELANDLSLTGSTAWGKLHGNLTSQIEVEVSLPGQPATLPMSAVRNLAYDPDPTVRRKAYEAELAAWKKNELVAAACLNGVKGEVATILRRRGWASALDEAVFNANIDRQTLDAMLGAARESFPVFRRYLRAKAGAIQRDGKGLAWFNLFAPIGKEARVWSYEEAKTFVAEQFGTYSDKMKRFAERAFSENWVDVAPRAGKRDGAFCSSLRRDESRVLMNFKPSFGSVSTLAHELGHAYHNLCLYGRTSLQRGTPMTLAETASIFCETIIRQAALASTDGAERLAILEASLQGSCQVVVDITSRFLFERAVFEKRPSRELSASEFCEIMLDAQRQTYGEGLDEDCLHPYMWAVKSHYYSGRGFYNFPYMYGLLFGLGLYSVYGADPDGFRSRYDDLLSSTGLDDAAVLGARFGIDVRSPRFWEGSLQVIENEVGLFEQAVAAMG